MNKPLLLAVQLHDCRQKGNSFSLMLPDGSRSRQYCYQYLNGSASCINTKFIPSWQTVSHCLCNSAFSLQITLARYSSGIHIFHSLCKMGTDSCWRVFAIESAAATRTQLMRRFNFVELLEHCRCMRCPFFIVTMQLQQISFAHAPCNAIAVIPGLLSKISYAL